MLDNQIRALVVDDSITIRKILKNNLARFNITCDEAGDGKLAWAMMFKHKYELVLTDYNMPEMNGLELAKKIFDTKDKFGNVCVVAVSSAFSDDLMKKFRAFGVEHFIAKPFSLETFKEAIAPVLSKDNGAKPEACALDDNQIARLFAICAPKTSFDGKYLIMDFGSEIMSIDASAVAKSASIYASEAND